MNELAKYIDFGQGVANPGYIWNIKDVMKRAEAGEKLTIGFIGGSITQGAGASSEKTNYVSLVGEYLKSTFSDKDVTIINAGIPGTDSKYGWYRLENDVISYNPDIVFI